METITVEKEKEALVKEIQDERLKLTTDRMDISFGEIINLYKNGELIIRPEYQRLYRWTSFQKTSFIESILLGIPIPPIFVAEDKDGIWELVDGLQRISTFISFFGEFATETPILDEPVEIEDEEMDENELIVLENRWELESGSIIKNMKGFNIDTLPRKLSLNLKRAVCRVEILRGQSQLAMKYELFKRLNSGGTKANAQEIRNAIYRGFNSKLNDFIVELSKNRNFIKLSNLSVKKKKELYDHELVLRFVAFLNNIDNINDNTERFLDQFMLASVSNENFDFDYYRNIFNEVLEMVSQLGDDKVFRTEKNFFIPSEFEGICIGIAQNIGFYGNNIDLLRTKVFELKNDKVFKNYSGTASNSRSRIKNRLKRANEIFSNGRA